MKIAVSSKGTTLDAEMDERFGRAAYILIVDTDTMAVEVLDNSVNNSAAQGAGIQAASMVEARGAKVLLTGSCGPKAMNTFSAVNIEVYTGQLGTVREAVERFQKGSLKPSATANVAEKFGMAGVGPALNRNGASPSASGGMGGGRGRGISCGGRGMGGGGRGRGIAGGGQGMGGGGQGRGIAGGGQGMGGGGQGRGIAGGGQGMGGGGGTGSGMGSSVNPVSMVPSKAETVEDLKKQAEALKAQLDAIQKKIKSL